MKIELRPLPVAMKMALFRAMRVVRLTPTAKAVLQFLIDEVNSAYWSRDRMALACGRSPRAIDDALAQLKGAGFISIAYRRRSTSVKVLCVDAILNAVKHGVDRAKRASAAAISMIRRGFQASQVSARNVLNSLIKVEQNAAWRQQAAPTASLLRALQMTKGTSRG